MQLVGLLVHVANQKARLTPVVVSDCSSPRAGKDFTSLYVVWATGHITETLPDIPYKVKVYSSSFANKSQPGAKPFATSVAASNMHPEHSIVVAHNNLPRTSLSLALGQGKGKSELWC
jgi:hypothetical protein